MAADQWSGVAASTEELEQLEVELKVEQLVTRWILWCCGLY